MASRQNGVSVVKTESRSSVCSVCIKHGGLKKMEQQDGNKQ